MPRSEGSGSRVAAVVTVLVVALVATACGAAPWRSAIPPGPASPKIVLDAVRKTTDAKSARLSARESITGIGSDDSGILINGVTNLTTGDGNITMDFTGAVGSIMRDGLALRVLHGVAYLQIPASLPNGGFWEKFPSVGAAEASSGVSGLDASVPLKFLAYLETVSKGVRVVGAAAVRNVATIHYKVQANLSRAIAAAKVPPALRDQLRQDVQTPTPGGSSVRVDAWIDSRGLVRRVEMSLGVSTPAIVARLPAGSKPVVTIVLDLYDFGTPVHVNAPRANQIVPTPPATTTAP
jgi:hypothetical protein